LEQSSCAHLGYKSLGLTFSGINSDERNNQIFTAVTGICKGESVTSKTKYDSIVDDYESEKKLSKTSLSLSPLSKSINPCTTGQSDHDDEEDPLPSNPGPRSTAAARYDEISFSGVSFQAGGDVVFSQSDHSRRFAFKKNLLSPSKPSVANSSDNPLTSQLNSSPQLSSPQPSIPDQQDRNNLDDNVLILTKNTPRKADPQYGTQVAIAIAVRNSSISRQELAQQFPKLSILQSKYKIIDSENPLVSKTPDNKTPPDTELEHFINHADRNNDEQRFYYLKSGKGEILLDRESAVVLRTIHGLREQVNAISEERKWLKKEKWTLPPNFDSRPIADMQDRAYLWLFEEIFFDFVSPICSERVTHNNLSFITRARWVSDLLVSLCCARMMAEFPNYYIECTASAWDGEKRVLEAQKRKAGKFWIIFIHGNHFVVTYQMEHQKNVTYFDSFGHSPDQETKRKIHEVFGEVDIVQIPNGKRGSGLPFQNDSVSCGIFAVTMVLYRIKELPFQFNQSHIDFFRLFWLDRIFQIAPFISVLNSPVIRRLFFLGLTLLIHSYLCYWISFFLFSALTRDQLLSKIASKFI